MSVVGELPIDIAGLTSTEYCFDQFECSHTRRPSHRRTASLVMYLDDDCFGQNPALHRPGTPPATAAASVFQLHNRVGQGFGGEHLHQKLEENSWGGLEDLKIKTQREVSAPTVPKLASKALEGGAQLKKSEKQSMEELFGSFWGGAEAGTKTNTAPLTGRSSRSSQGTPTSKRSTGSPFKSLLGQFNVFRSRYNIDRHSATSPTMLSDASLDAIKSHGDHFSEPLGHRDDDCESTGTVVEVDSEDALSSQAEDANMRNDLYSDFEKTSQVDDSLTNGSIDEDEFPIDTIAESTLESQKTQDISNADVFSDDVNHHMDAEMDSADEDSESVDIIHGSPTSPVVHSHTISDASQPESDMPLPEIVTGSILQGLHDEISQKLEEELREVSTKDTQKTNEQAVDDSLYPEDMYETNWTSKVTEEKLYLGMRWVNVVPDKHLVEKIHDGIIKAGEFVVTHWKWVPVVALPFVVIALTR